MDISQHGNFRNNYSDFHSGAHEWLWEELQDLLTEKDKGQDLYADSAYTGEVQEKAISKYEIHEKGYRGKPLTKVQEEKNKEKSGTCVWV